MTKYNKKKQTQLGISPSTASNILKKQLFFSLLKEVKRNYCFQCGLEITSIKELSIEHKKPWLDEPNPVELFFDHNNIAYSHLKCNRLAARKPLKILGLDDDKLTHGNSGYRRGCKCNLCRQWKVEENKRNR